MTQTVELSGASIEAYLHSLEVKNRSPHTIKAHRADLSLFKDEWFNKDVTLEPDEYEEAAMKYLRFMEEVDMKAPATIGRYLGTLRQYGRWWGMHDPLNDYSAPSPPRTTPNPIDAGPEGVRNMLLMAGDDHEKRALVALCGFAGLRVSEARALRKQDAEFLRKRLTVHGKGNKYRVIPMSDLVKEVLMERLANMDEWDSDTRFVQFCDRSAREIITRLADDAGLGHVSSHQLRATFATATYGKTKNIRVTQELLGHSDSRTTEIYTGVADAEMREAIEI